MTPTMIKEVEQRVAQEYFFLPSPSTSPGGEPASPSFRVEQHNGLDYWVHSDVPVFRSGTFRNSFGEEKSWDRSHLETMASNFQLLKKLGKVESVPVRADHPGMFEGGSIQKVVGYITDVRVEDREVKELGETYSYLIAEYEILDPNAQDKIARRLWRNRSAEIGRYTTNSPESEYWPTLLGLAYVDFSAVEHLNGFSQSSTLAENHFSFTESRFAMSEDNQKNGPKVEQAKTPEPAPTFMFSLAGKQTQDFAAVQNYIQEIENENATLNEFRSKALEVERVSYVQKLASENKVFASQVEHLTEFAKSLTGEQFAKFCESYDTTESMPVLGTYGRDNQERPDSGENQQKDKASTGREVISAWQRSGAMSADEIKKTQTYREVVAADPSFAL